MQEAKPNFGWVIFFFSFIGVFNLIVPTPAVSPLGFAGPAQQYALNAMRWTLLSAHLHNIAASEFIENCSNILYKNAEICWIAF